MANGDLNAVDIEGLTDDTYFTLTTAPTHGIATIHPESGNWTYTPNANYFGNDGFQVTVTDDLQGTTPALLQITVTPVDDPAIITGDFNATIAEDGVANGDLNAVDIEGLTDDTYFTLTHRTDARNCNHSSGIRELDIHPQCELLRKRCFPSYRDRRLAGNDPRPAPDHRHPG